MRAEDLERRSRALTVLLALFFFILIARLGSLQLLGGEKWEAMARDQRIRLVSIAAPRGNIYDRNGVLLAGNEPAFTVSLVYTGKPMPETAVRRLSRILNMDADDIHEAAKRLQPAYGRPYQPVPLKSINEIEHTQLEEFRDELPGVVVEVQPLRVYPGLLDFPEMDGAVGGGRLAAHVLGTVKKADYSPAIQGTDALEFRYNGAPTPTTDPAELGLQGRDGIRQVEVDSQGRPIRVLREIPPVPGNDLVLTIDARLQAAAERGLWRRMTELRQMRNETCPNGCAAESGAAVVIDIRTGEILAMASAPSYDPNAFARRVYAVPGTQAYQDWQNTWKRLNEDRAKPLYNHATMDTAPPGSTFKPVTALAALEEKVTTPSERVGCPGYRIYDGHRFNDWRAHGAVNLEQALGRSCDVYFYEMGARLKIKALYDMARKFGLGQKTGLEERDGIREEAGWVAGPETKSQLHKNDPTWYRSQNLSVAIGQDDHQFSTLQMANMTAILANGGTRYQPFVVQSINSPDGQVLQSFKPKVLGRVDATPENIEAVRKGMLAVTRINSGWSGPDSAVGTAYNAFADFPQKTKEHLGREIQVGGKTGTAETGRKGEISFGWFIAYAPYDKPEIAVAVFVRHGGGGSLAGAPVARAILDEYFGLNQPLPQEPAEPPAPSLAPVQPGAAPAPANVQPGAAPAPANVPPGAPDQTEPPAPAAPQAPDQAQIPGPGPDEDPSTPLPAD